LVGVQGRQAGVTLLLQRCGPLPLLQQMRR
jgi:hypothetical protein